MAHFAKLGVGNIVETVEAVSNNVILDENGIEQEQLGINFLRELYNEPNAQWFQTSYSNSLRKNFAGVGFTYDATRDAFYAPQPYPSWTLNETTCIWEAPVARPDDGLRYEWNEETQTWDEITTEE